LAIRLKVPHRRTNGSQRTYRITSLAERQNRRRIDVIPVWCQQLIDEIDDLLAPPGPVVSGVETPVVDPGRNVFLLEQSNHLSGTVKQFILPRALSYAHNDAAMTVDVPIGMVGRPSYGASAMPSTVTPFCFSRWQKFQ